MEKKGRKLYRTFTRWSLSYVILSTVGILVIFFCTMKYSEALRADLEYTNSVQLELVQLQMDRNVRNLRAFASKANLNKMVDDLRGLNSYEDVSRYDLYVLMKELAGEMLWESGSQDTYLYFPAMDLLLSGSYYNNSREYYEIAFESYGFVYEDWYDVISKDYRTAQIFSLETQKGTPLIVLVKPLDSSSRQTPAVNAIMILDMEEILRASQWLSQDRDNICIIDKSSRKVVSHKALEPELEEILAGSRAAGDKNSRYETGDSVISCISSLYENWDYAVITQEQGMVAVIGELQRLVILLILVYLVISAAIIGYASFRHYLPLQKVVSILQQQDDREEDHMDGDTYEYISKSVNKLVDENKEHTSVISRQRSAISRELLHRLLTEKRALELIDQELLRQCGIQVGDCLCGILSYRLEASSSFDEGTGDTQEMSWFILQNVTEENLAAENLEFLCFREGRQEQIFLFWSEQEEHVVWEAAGRALQISAEFMGSHFKIPYRMALSDLHQGTEEIYMAYREVNQVFEYQRQEEGREVVIYRDINLLPVDTLLRYPMDVENRLVHWVSTGDDEAACREVRRLLEDNQVNCLAPEAMQFLVSNIAASVIRVAGKVSKETALPISQKALMEACRQGESGRMREELERLVVTACREIGEFNKRERDNQKGKLYLDIRTYVEENYSNPELSVNSMAEQFGVQAAYLSRVFKEASGDKLSQYIHAVRLAHVKELLLGDTRLEDIAARCGFGSQRTFLRIFKQYEGVTPTQYKELDEKKRKEEQGV